MMAPDENIERMMRSLAEKNEAITAAARAGSVTAAARAVLDSLLAQCADMMLFSDAEESE